MQLCTGKLYIQRVSNVQNVFYNNVVKPVLLVTGSSSKEYTKCNPLINADCLMKIMHNSLLLKQMRSTNKLFDFIYSGLLASNYANTNYKMKTEFKTLTMYTVNQ